MLTRQVLRQDFLQPFKTRQLPYTRSFTNLVYVSPWPFNPVSHRDSAFSVTAGHLDNVLAVHRRTLFQ